MKIESRGSSGELRRIHNLHSLQVHLTHVMRSAPEVSFPLANSFNANLDNLGIDFSREISSGEVLQAPWNWATALHYSYLMTDRDISTLADLDAYGWDSVIEGIVKDQQMSKIFHENMWRPPTTVIPSRGVPVHRILRHEFGDDPVRLVDLGAGTNSLSAMFDSSYYTDSEFPGDEDILQYALPVNLDLGIGIDKQRREKTWAKAANWPIFKSFVETEATEESIDRAFADDRRFPFIQEDVTNGELCLEKVRTELINHNGIDTPNVAVSSFLGHQLGYEFSTHEQFRKFVTRMLPENGIWIDISINSSRKYPVNVSRKVNGKLEIPQQPFIMDEYRIIQTNMDYFKS